MQRNAVWVVLLSILASTPASAGRVELLTKKGTPGPAQAVGMTGGYDMSADGRFVTFSSSSPNLVTGQIDGNNTADIFLWDRNSGEIRLVSHRAGEPTRASHAIINFHIPRISADGRWVAFCHSGRNLIPGQQETIRDWVQVYLYDRLSETVTLVSRSIASPSRGGDYDSCLQGGLSLSSDGRYLAFQSSAGDLVSPQVPFGENHLYLYDRITSQITLMSHAAGNPTQRANGGADWPSMSADGRWIAYRSSSTDLVAGVTDGNNDEDAFLFDRTTGVNILVSHASGSSTTTANRESYGPEISADGSWIAFSSGASNLVSGQTDANPGPDVFLWERATGTTRLVSHVEGNSTTAGNSTSSSFLGISADGSRIAYGSTATDLVTGITDAFDTSDVFLFDRSTGTNTLVSRAAGTTATANGRSEFSSFSADGNRVLFASLATDLVAGVTDANGAYDLFAREQASGNMTLVSHIQGSTSTTGNSGSSGALSPDGLSVVLISSASDLAGGDTNGGNDVFFHALGSGTNIPVSFSPAVSVASGSGFSENLSRQVMSADGRFIVFRSRATDLVPGQVDDNSDSLFGGRDIFLYDRETGLSTLVSHSAGSPTTTADHDSSEVNISRDGRFVVFTSYASDLVPGQTTGDGVFLFDRLTGNNIMVSHQAGSTTTSFCGYCTFSQISEDGSSIAFLNWSSLNFYERATDTLTLIHPGAQVTGLALSTGGRYLAFVSNATGLVPGQSDSNGGQDVFLYDRITGSTILVSRSASSPAVTGNTEVHGLVEVSADGRFVMFTSGATDHVPGQTDTNNQGDLFLFDRTTGTVSLVSHAAASPTTAANGASPLGAISRDGRFIAFMSGATNLVPGQQANALGGVYLYDRLSGTISLVSHVAGSLTESGGGRIPAISGDGSRVSFVSRSAGLIPGIVDENGDEDVFLYDRSSGSLELVSRTLASPGKTGNAPATFRTAVSEDGRVVVFSSGAGDLVADDSNISQDVFAFVPEDLDFYTLTPCRLFDSRRPEDGPALSSGFATVVEIDGACGIPATAHALAVNITVVLPGTSGNLIAYPGDGLPPLASSLNFSAGQTRANNAVVRLAPSGNGTLAMRPVLAGGGSVHVVLDVIGYFE